MEQTELNIQQPQQPQQPETLEQKLIHHRENWTNEIKELNEKMKTLPKLDELLTIIYAKRQDAVDYYYSMNNVILNQNRKYKKSANDMFMNIKTNGFNGVRFPNDTAIMKIIETELAGEHETIELLSNHNNYIKETIATIDNMIYGINQKIKLAEILNGLKF